MKNHKKIIISGMKKHKKIIIITVILLLPVLTVLFFKLLTDFRRSSLYVEFPGLSVDGKSFYIKRIYNCDGRTMSPGKDIIPEIRNYASSLSQPEILLNRKSDSFSFMDVNEAVVNNELYLNVTGYKGMSGQSIAENTLTKYMKDGPSQSVILPDNCHGMYNNPCNLIIIEPKNGIYSYEPFSSKRKFLCNYPAVKNDAGKYLSLRNPGAKGNTNKISRYSLRIHTGIRPTCFVMAVFCEMPSGDRFPLIYVFRPDIKELININRYLTKDDEEKLLMMDTVDLATIQETTRQKISDELKKNNRYPDFTEDYFGNDRIEIENSNILHLHQANGTVKNMTVKGLQNRIISKAFFFKPDNVIIAQVSIDNHSFGPGSLTEIAAIDPATGDTRIISPLCPAEQRKNDPYYSFLFNLADGAYKLRGKMPESVRSYF